MAKLSTFTHSEITNKGSFVACVLAHASGYGCGAGYIYPPVSFALPSLSEANPGRLRLKGREQLLLTRTGETERRPRVWARNGVSEGPPCESWMSRAMSRETPFTPNHRRKPIENWGLSGSVSLSAHEKTPRSRRFATVGFKLRGQDSNLRPRGYEPRELPGCSTPRYVVVPHVRPRTNENAGF